MTEHKDKFKGFFLLQINTSQISLEVSFPTPVNRKGNMKFSFLWMRIYRPISLRILKQRPPDPKAIYHFVIVLDVDKWPSLLRKCRYMLLHRWGTEARNCGFID